LWVTIWLVTIIRIYDWIYENGANSVLFHQVRNSLDFMTSKDKKEGREKKVKRVEDIFFEFLHYLLFSAFKYMIDLPYAS